MQSSMVSPNATGVDSNIKNPGVEHNPGVEDMDDQLAKNAGVEIIDNPGLEQHPSLADKQPEIDNDDHQHITGSDHFQQAEEHV